jgi:hypothetical protein
MMKNGFLGLPNRRISDLNTSISISGSASTTPPNLLIGVACRGRAVGIVDVNRLSSCPEGSFQLFYELDVIDSFEHVTTGEKLI